MREPLKLAPEARFIAELLNWARRAQVYGTFLPIIVYRGHSSQNWTLLPSLCRNNFPPEMLEHYEQQVIQRFRENMNLADWTDMRVLAYARHHGAPTRLIDWSRNVLAALWFAVQDKAYDSDDGVIFRLWLHRPSKLLTLLVNVTSLDFSKVESPVVVFAAPPEIDRTDRQKSVFSLAKFEYARTPLEEILAAENPPLVSKFPIPARLKPELRRLLSDVGLDAFTLYGGPDFLGKSLETHLDLKGIQIV